jgi:hypothetical protein
MYTTVKTQGGIIAPLQLNDIEFQRRYLAWRKQEDKKERLEKLYNTDIRRANYWLRKVGADGVFRMDQRSRQERMEREQRERERIAELMALEAAKSLGVTTCW